MRHGDGTLVYAYVEFDTETISGEELLLRSGLEIVVAPFSGLGSGVCAIDGEGCPADDCYCASYSSPAYYWNYYARTGAGWAVQLRGPTGRQLADGDIDGWSWTAGDHGLPAVTIDEIAELTGFDRTPDPTATLAPQPTPPSLPSTPIPPPTAAPTSPPAATPTATMAASSTPVEPSPTGVVTRTATIAPATATNPDRPPTATATASPTTTTVAATSTPIPSATATVAASATSTLGMTAPTATPTAGTGAVIVRPGGTPTPLEPAPDDGGLEERNLLLFGGFVTLIVGAGAFAVIRRSRGVE